MLRKLLVVLLLFVPSIASAQEASPSPAPEDAAQVQTILAALQLPEPPPPTEPPIWSKERLFEPADLGGNATQRANQLWKQFRKAYPFGLQAVAATAPDSKGTCAVVVAEPPPHVSLGQIRALIPDAHVLSQTVMHDGALFDVAGTLTGGDAAIQKVLDGLQLLLFRTRYGAAVLHPPFRGTVGGARYKLNVRPTAVELDQWICDPSARFQARTGGPALRLSELDARGSDVYHVSGIPLVVWYVPKAMPISTCLVQAREFAIDTDLIAGAVQDQGLLICGRQRVAPVDVLPPLRSETIALLASVAPKRELSQSYQRTHPGAGEYSGEYDWAPILLSPELVDTEYGHLLNVADQMLKGWSENGRCHYKNFKYPAPDHWPFPKPLGDIVADMGSNQVTFNWNTTGASYAVKFGTRTVYAPNWTGALPVSYIPGEVAAKGTQNMLPLENTGYHYYTTLENPVLARVVQYAALYQIFHNLSVAAPVAAAPVETGPESVFATTMDAFRARVEEIDAANGGKPLARVIDHSHAMSQRIKAVYADQLQKELKKRNLDKLAGEQKKAVAGKVRDILSEEEKKAHAGFSKAIEKSFQAWHALPADDKNRVMQGARSLSAAQAADPVNIETSSMFLCAVASSMKLAESYAAAVPNTFHSWIHTPTVVMSNNGLESYRSTGGHNVGGFVSELAADESVAAGAARFEDGAIKINPKDAAHLSEEVVHDLAREMRTPGADGPSIAKRLTEAIGKSEARPPRPAEVALGFTPVESRVPRTAHGAKVPVGATTAAAAAGEVPGGMRASAPNAFLVTKEGGGYLIAGHEGRTMRVSNLGDAADFIHAEAALDSRFQRGVKIEMAGMETSEASTLSDGVRLKRTQAGLREDVVGALESREPAAATAAGAEAEAAIPPRLDPIELDFAKARIEVEPLREVGERLEARLSVEIPRAETAPAGIKGVFVRIRMIFERTMSKIQANSVVAAVKQHVDRVLGRVAKVPVVDPAVELHNSLRQLKKFGVEGLELRLDGAASSRLLVGCPRVSHLG